MIKPSWPILDQLPLWPALSGMIARNCREVEAIAQPAHKYPPSLAAQETLLPVYMRGLILSLYSAPPAHNSRTDTAIMLCKQRKHGTKGPLPANIGASYSPLQAHTREQAV